jgi:hypothetical protein
MNTCISDDDVIVNIQGIRYVTWGESTSYLNPGKHFYVTITYKGNHQSFAYTTEEKAKNLFNKIRAAMDKSVKEQ